MRPFYDALLTSLAEEIGLDAPSLLQTQEIVIDGLAISLQLETGAAEGEILRCSLLGPVPARRWPQVARALLWANHAGTGTRGGMLGVLPDDDMVTLSMRRTLPGLDAGKLAARLGWMADTRLAWKDYVSKGAAEPPALLHMQFGSFA
ncbi:MAG: type III secretion system chaperone [Comamonas sp.]